MVFADSLEGKTLHVCTGCSGTQGKAISLREQESVCWGRIQYLSWVMKKG